MVSAIKVDGRRLHELARAGRGGRTGAPDRPHRPDRGRGVRAPASFPAASCWWSAAAAPTSAAWPPTSARPLGGMRPPGLAAPPAGRAVHRRGGLHPRGDRRDPAKALLPLVEAVRHLPRVDVDGETARGVAHGAVFPVGALGRHRRRPARSPSSAPTAGCWPSTRRAGRRPGRSSSCPRAGTGGRGLSADLYARRQEPRRLPRACPGSVVTIGAFDGIHLGHQALLRLVREEAAERGLADRPRHLRPPPGPGRAARVGPQAPHQPRPEARAAGGDRARRPRRRPHLRRRPPPGNGRGLRDRGARRLPPGPARGGRGRLPLRQRPPGQRRPPGADGPRPRLRGRRARPRERRRRGHLLLDARPPAPGRRRRPGRRRDPRPGPRGAGHRGGGRPPGPGAGLPDGQRRRPRGDLPARRRASTPAPSPAPTASNGPPPSRSAAAPPSTPTRPTCCSRPTCSTSRATSTASRPRCGFVDRIRAEERFDSVEALVAAMHRDVEAPAASPPGCCGPRRANGRLGGRRSRGCDPDAA